LTTDASPSTETAISSPYFPLVRLTRLYAPLVRKGTMFRDSI